MAEISYQKRTLSLNSILRDHGPHRASPILDRGLSSVSSNSSFPTPSMDMISLCPIYCSKLRSCGGSQSLWLWLRLHRYKSLSFPRPACQSLLPIQDSSLHRFAMSRTHKSSIKTSKFAASPQVSLPVPEALRLEIFTLESRAGKLRIEAEEMKRGIPSFLPFKFIAFLSHFLKMFRCRC